MTASDIVNLIGLGMATIGAILLAYDVIYGPGMHFQAEVLSTQLETLKKTRTYSRGIIEKLPNPPYKPEDVQKMLADEEKEWGPQETELTRKSSTFLARYKDRVVTFGAFGVCLIVLGFVLQFIAVMIHKPGT